MLIAKSVSQLVDALGRIQYRTALFTSKRRSQAARNANLLSPAGQKQRQQMNRLRATLAIEPLSQLPLSLASVENSMHVQPFDHIAEEYVKNFKRTQRRKDAKYARALELPLFREGSALFRHYGSRTLGDYDKLPTTRFDGLVTIIHSAQEEEEHTEYLRAQKVVGVDTEARPDFRPLKGAKANPVCLIQVSTLERAFLYRLKRGKPLPSMLHELFADVGVLKVGHSLSDDFRLLKSSNLVHSVNSTVDTLYITHKLGCMRPGLKTSCQVFLGGSLDKTMQVSDWEAPVLSNAQIRYAATDAWAPLRVLLAMIQMEDTKQWLRTKSYNSSSRTIVNEDHNGILGKLLSFALSHQLPTID
ncbi:hypothetical protein CCR75_003736 [Bremia lactucae]|uniref:3'-5' exonuclease domain-containing protein n=1 Tax=Bremia lactucae TaxID=4779 RepID=A0A976IEW7_BRELC|nr:hypothetical protein CCR75_003736 [Bremia lactucae]